MIDIGCINRHLKPGKSKERIDAVQLVGNRLAARINGVFTLIGHRACQFQGRNGITYHALIHNQADSKEDVLVLHPAGEGNNTFEAINTGNGWSTNYIDMDQLDILMEAVSQELLEHANRTYQAFILRNEGQVAPPLTGDEIDLDAFAEDLSHMDISMSHTGNMRLAY